MFSDADVDKCFQMMFICVSYVFSDSVDVCFQSAVSAAEPAYGCTAGIHLCGTAGQVALGSVDRPGHPVRDV